MALLFKKRLSLAFLGEDYKDSYVNLRAISVHEYDNFGDKTVKEVILDHFLDGEVNQEEGLIKVTKATAKELPHDVFTEAFTLLIGSREAGQLDPKSEAPLTKPSSTAPTPPEN